MFSIFPSDQHKKKRISARVPLKLKEEFESYLEKIGCGTRKQTSYMNSFLKFFIEMAEKFAERGMPIDKSYIIHFFKEKFNDEFKKDLISKEDIFIYINEYINKLYGNLGDQMNKEKELVSILRKIPLDQNSYNLELEKYYDLPNDTLQLLKGMEEFGKNISILKNPQIPPLHKDYDVLLLDDKETNIQMATREFTKHGISIFCVDNYVEFIVFLNRHKPRIVLLDAHLSGIKKGYEICKLLKVNDKFKDLTIIIYSSQIDKDPEEIKKKYKADDFISKGVGYEETFELVIKYLKD